MRIRNIEWKLYCRLLARDIPVLDKVDWIYFEFSLKQTLKLYFCTTNIVFSYWSNFLVHKFYEAFLCIISIKLNFLYTWSFFVTRHLEIFWITKYHSNKTILFHLIKTSNKFISRNTHLPKHLTYQTQCTPIVNYNMVTNRYPLHIKSTPHKLSESGRTKAILMHLERKLIYLPSEQERFDSK